MYIRTHIHGVIHELWVLLYEMNSQVFVIKRVSGCKISYEVWQEPNIQLCTTKKGSVKVVGQVHTYFFINNITEF